MPASPRLHPLPRPSTFPSSPLKKSHHGRSLGGRAGRFDHDAVDKHRVFGLAPLGVVVELLLVKDEAAADVLLQRRVRLPRVRHLLKLANLINLRR